MLGTHVNYNYSLNIYYCRMPQVPVLGTWVLGLPFLLGPSSTTRRTGLSPTSQRKLHSNVILTSTIDN
jgi:hypothetical protein